MDENIRFMIIFLPERCLMEKNQELTSENKQTKQIHMQQIKQIKQSLYKKKKNTNIDKISDIT